MFLMFNVHVLSWTNVVKHFTVKRTQPKTFYHYPLDIQDLSGTAANAQTKRVSMCFPESKSVFLSRQNCKLEMFLIQIEILG